MSLQVFLAVNAARNIYDYSDKYGENMKHKSLQKFVIAILLVCTLSATLCSCIGVDPNVKTKETTAEKYEVETQAKDSDGLLEGFNAYGDGMTSPLKVKGVKVDVEAFALRSYELAFMLAQPKFKSVKKASVDALAQYAFIHVFFKNFYEITNKVTEFRQATPDQVLKEFKKHFGKANIDLKKSMLYNKGKNKFEMWLPEYGTNIFYRVDAAEVKGSKAVITTTFYNEFKKNTKLGRTEITVKIEDGKPVIEALA